MPFSKPMTRELCPRCAGKGTVPCTLCKHGERYDGTICSCDSHGQMVCPTCLGNGVREVPMRLLPKYSPSGLRASGVWLGTPTSTCAMQVLVFWNLKGMKWMIELEENNLILAEVSDKLKSVGDSLWHTKTKNRGRWVRENY